VLQKCNDCENNKLPINQLPDSGIGADRSRAFRFRRIYDVQSNRSKNMIAISIMCVLLIWLFRLNLDEVSSES
jgi:hypothetical protein